MFKGYAVIASVSEKKDGSMKVYADNSEEDVIAKNRAAFLRKSGVDEKRSVGAYLVHSSNITRVGKGDGGKFFEATDGFVTDEKGIFLTVTVSDCLPVFLFDPKAEVVALAHAGWGGLEGKIITKALDEMGRLGASAPDILAVIGPGLGKLHYEVGSELVEKFSHIPGATETENGKFFLDIKKIALSQLIDGGVSRKNIEISAEDTFQEKDKYFSYRRDSYGDPHNIQSMLAVFGMKK